MAEIGERAPTERNAEVSQKVRITLFVRSHIFCRSIFGRRRGYRRIFLFRFFHIWGNWDLPRAIERGAQARTEVREDRRAPRPAAPWRLGAGPGVPYPQAQLNRQSPHAQHHTRLSLSLPLTQASAKVKHFCAPLTHTDTLEPGTGHRSTSADNMADNHPPHRNRNPNSSASSPAHTRTLYGCSPSQRQSEAQGRVRSACT